MTVILRGQMIQLAVVERVAEVRVQQRDDVNHFQGAAGVAEVERMVVELFTKPHTLLGLLVDVRNGPPAFGTKTRNSLAAMFRAVTEGGGRCAMVCGDSPMQQLQFASLQEEFGAAHVFVGPLRGARTFVEGAAT